ncbi:MAG: outer membrane protein transport protein [Myxococcota bacterium]|nr:outer membrane protein transport protein [Myxococcota bacterium]
MQKTKYFSSKNGLVWAALLLLPLSVAAGGLEFPDLGTTAIGRGTAFVARADDPSAFYYNPAGLSKRPGFFYLLGANLVFQDLTFTRSGSGRDIPVSDNLAKWDPALDYSNGPEGEPFKPTSSEAKMGPAPMLVLGYNFELPKEQVLGISLGLLTPSAFGAPKYPKDGSQRYVLTEANFLLAYPGIGLSYSMNRFLRIGAVFMSGMAILHQSQAVRLQPQSGDPDYNEDAGGDAYLKVEAKDHFIPTAVFGVMSNPFDFLEVGASLKLPAKVEAEGTLKLTPPTDDFPEAALLPGMNKLTLAQQFPLVLRVGARYIHPRFDVELDIVWENWSSLKGFDVDNTATVHLDDDHGDIDLPDTSIPKNFRDTVSVRLGGDVEVLPEVLALRLGAYYQTSAYPKNNDTFSVDFPYGQQIGLGGGLTWHAVSWLDVVAGYMHVFQPDVVVKEGKVQQMGPPVQDVKDGVAGDFNIGSVVNNGKYELSLNVVGLTLEGHF